MNMIRQLCRLKFLIGDQLTQRQILSTIYSPTINCSQLIHRTTDKMYQAIIVRPCVSSSGNL